MRCATCNGRGYVLRYKGDAHGDTCPECRGGIPESVLTGPPPKRRNAKVTPAPKKKRTPLFVGPNGRIPKPTGMPQHEPITPVAPEAHRSCIVEGCDRPLMYGERVCRPHHTRKHNKGGFALGRRELTEAEVKQARSMAVFLSPAQIARKLRCTAGDVKKALGR